MNDGNQGKRANLGRGLAALLGDDAGDYAALDRQPATRQVPIEHLHPSRVQPRVSFDEEALEALAESIRSQGILQPILVRRHPERAAEFEIVAGERRWRAAQRARLHEVPIVVRELDDGQALELAIVENVQRQDLDPLEEAEGYRRLIEEFGHSQEALSRVIGKSRPHIANTLRLLNLAEPIKQHLRNGRLSAGHARALLGADAAEELAEQVVRRGLSVRETERLAAAGRPSRKGSPRGKSAAKPEKDADTRALETDLSNLLGLRVSIAFTGSGGTLTIHYETLEQLDDVLHRLNQAPPRLLS